MTLAWAGGRPYEVFRIDLKTKLGENVGKTAYGSDRGPEVISVTSGGVMPGKTFKRTVRLNRLYDLSLSGSYTVTVAVRFHSSEDGMGKMSTAAAPMFEFSVKDPDRDGGKDNYR